MLFQEKSGFNSSDIHLSSYVEDMIRELYCEDYLRFSYE